MSKIIIATSRPEHRWMVDEFRNGNEVFLIETPEDLKLEALEAIRPDFIFFPHWSNIISNDIYERFTCVVFHMTDLPFGRGGSPLQNLIERGFTTTKISAIKCVREVDAGPIFMKKDLNLEGSAREILDRCSKIIFEMISEILKTRPTPIDQVGAPTLFKRRTPEQSCISELTDTRKVYDYIRMLDADGYPHAFLETKNLRFEFTSAALEGEEVIANVRIRKRT